MKIIAYGSLQNKESLQATLERPVSYEAIEVRGYQKVFNAPFGGYAFLNLEEKQNSSFQCLYFEIQPDELSKFDEREAGSELIEIMPGYWAFVWPTNYCRNLPVLKSYIEVCQDAAQQNKFDFWQGTQQPKEILDDKTRPLYVVYR